MSTYPAPRYPRLKRPKSIDELMPRMRELLNQRTGITRGMRPDYNIVKGDKILLVALSEHHPLVINAFRAALIEKGARVDLLTLDSTPVAPPEELPAHEIISLGQEEGDYSYYYSVMCDLIRTSTARAMIREEKYTKIISGAAGPIPEVPVPWLRFSFPDLEDFAAGIIDFPTELWTTISRKTFDRIMSCHSLTFTDPEGTEIKWTNYNDEREFIRGHMLARPYNIGHGFNGRDDCTGVVAGTTNHMGAYPHIKVHIEGGQVARVEGGGKYGDVWREKLEKYRRTELPPLSRDYSHLEKYQIAEPGLFWYFECAIGAEPGVFRLMKEGLFQCYANFLHERRRTGFVHHGFGPPALGESEMIAAGLPWVHVHVHSMFATMVGITSKGEKVTIIDRGHLVALDDEEIKTLAGKYGDPDSLLREAWFPAMPGINAPGDYMKDYARNPVPWIQKETASHPTWVD